MIQRYEKVRTGVRSIQNNKTGKDIDIKDIEKKDIEKKDIEKKDIEKKDIALYIQDIILHNDMILIEKNIIDTFVTVLHVVPANGVKYSKERMFFEITAFVTSGGSRFSNCQQ